MGSWHSALVLVAEGAAPEQPGAGGILGSMLVPLALTFAFFYFLIIVPERRRTKKKQELLDALKKNDEVVTIGGIYGIVANVKPGDDHVVLRVDDENNVKIRVARSSIAHVVTKKEEA